MGGSESPQHAGIPAGDALAEVRTKELQCAAEKLGIQPPIQFGLQDQMKMGKASRSMASRFVSCATG